MATPDPHEDMSEREQRFWAWFDGLHLVARVAFVVVAGCLVCPWFWLLLFLQLYCGGVPMG